MKTVNLVPYENRFHEGVLQCIRGFEPLKEISQNELEEWFAPLITYSWKDDINITDFPYKYGLVVLDNEEKVVGYCGLIYSYITCNNKRLSCVNATTWIIEPKYGVYMLEAMRIMVESADIVTNFTPIAKVQAISKKMFGFNMIEDKAYKLIPQKPEGEWEENSIRTRYLNHENCDSEVVKKYLIDHEKYGCKCIEFSSADDKDKCQILFYRTKSQNGKAWLHILECTNPTFWGDNMQFIAWKMFELEGLPILSDARFITPYFSFKGIIEIVPRSRMLLNKSEIDIPINLLYSEMILLRH